MIDIPKVAYFYWGGSAMSYFNALSALSFRKLHPDFRIVLYRPAVEMNIEPRWKDHMQKVPYRGPDYTYLVEKVADKVIDFDYEQTIQGARNDLHNVHKADILRQYLMFYQGGLWSDFDVLWIRRAEFPEHDVGMVYSQLNTKTDQGFYSTGIVTAKPGTNFYKMIHKRSVLRFEEKLYQCAGPDLIRAIFPTWGHLVKRFGGTRFLNYGFDTFYPVHYNKLQFLYRDRVELPEHCMGVHWYGGAVMSMEMKNLITPDNWKRITRGSTLGDLLEKLID